MASLFKSLVVWILISLEIFILFASTMSMSDYDKRERIRCSRKLVEELALICNNEYESIIHTDKRSDETYDGENDELEPLIDDVPKQYHTYAYLSKLMPETALKPRMRRWGIRYGLVDECCHKPCSVQQLRLYCKRKN